MGKGSKPRNNHSTEWFSNYDDINWNTNPRDFGLTSEQIDLYHAACAELRDRGIKVTRADENDIIDAIVGDIPAGWDKE